MANVNHSTLTDPYLHEPKGVSSASTGSVYVSDGAGSGDWTKAHAHVNGYVSFNSSTPITESIDVSFSEINPTFLSSHVDGFTGGTSPSRLIYTGTDTVTAFCTFTFNFRNNSGTSRDLELLFYKNGVTVANGGHIIVTASSGEWRSATLSDTISLSTNDYITIAAKADASFTLDIAAASLIINGVPA